jgi:hypothetical protein
MPVAGLLPYEPDGPVGSPIPRGPLSFGGGQVLHEAWRKYSRSPVT